MRKYAPAQARTHTHTDPPIHPPTRRKRYKIRVACLSVAPCAAAGVLASPALAGAATRPLVPSRSRFLVSMLRPFGPLAYLVDSPRCRHFGSKPPSGLSSRSSSLGPSRASSRRRPVGPRALRYVSSRRDLLRPAGVLGGLRRPACCLDPARASRAASPATRANGRRPSVPRQCRGRLAAHGPLAAPAVSATRVVSRVTVSTRPVAHEPLVGPA